MGEPWAGERCRNERGAGAGGRGAGGRRGQGSDAGPDAVVRFLEFFAGRIANERTRAAYGRAVGQFLAWCEARGLGLDAVSSLHVAAYIRTHRRKFLEHIDTGTLAGLRDRALFSVMLYSFARVSAVLGMRRQDYFQQGSRGWLRLHEKGGRRHDVPAHHRAAEALDAYIEAGGLADVRAALFQERGPGGGEADGAAVDAAGGAGDDQAAGGRGGAAGVNVLSHVPRDGDHGVSVERGDAGARPADRRARVAQDDEALRPDGGHRDRRRDRTHRDLTYVPGRFHQTRTPIAAIEARANGLKA